MPALISKIMVAMEPQFLLRGRPPPPAPQQTRAEAGSAVPGKDGYFYPREHPNGPFLYFPSPFSPVLEGKKKEMPPPCGFSEGQGGGRGLSADPTGMRLGAPGGMRAPFLHPSAHMEASMPFKGSWQSTISSEKWAQPLPTPCSRCRGTGKCEPCSQDLARGRCPAHGLPILILSLR